MSLEGCMQREIELVEEDFNNGHITLQERNERIGGIEKEAREYEEECHN